MYQVGEGFAGAGADAAHVNTVLGSREGPVGTAWATALASPSAGHTPFLVVVRPNVPVQPPTLFVNKAAIANDVHGRLTWGAAQAGVAAGVLAALRAGVISESAVRDVVLIAAVWVDPGASDTMAVFDNNEFATLTALTAGRDGRPTLAETFGALPPRNPYFSP
jgi:5,6,7,8-tetrahydromethanopterin hydro-lyase